MNAMEGQLGAGVLANLLQYLAMDRATGCLILRQGGTRQGTLYLRDGAVVHARAAGASDLDAVAHLLGWRQGRFVFREGIRPPYETLAMPTDQILLEASVRADDAHRASRGALPAGTVLELVEGGAAESLVATTLRGIRLLREVDGARDLVEIAERIEAPLDAVLASAEELVRQGLVAASRTPTLGSDFVDELTRLVIERIGPMGEIVVEDALYDLGIEPSAVPRNVVPELLDEIAVHLRRDDWAREFRERATALVRSRRIEPPP